MRPDVYHSILTIMWYGSAALICVYTSNILAYALS